MVTLTGTTVSAGTTSSPLVGATVTAFTLSGTMLATTTSTAGGAFSLTVPSGGVPVDAFLKVTASGRIETDWFPPAPLAANSATGEINLFDSSTLNLLASFAGVSLNPAASQAFFTVNDCAGAAISKATVGATPAPGKIRYIANGFPSTTATSTDKDGTALLLNVPAGNVALTANSGTTALRTRTIKSTAAVLLQISLRP